MQQLIRFATAMCLVGLSARAQAVDFCDAHPELHVGQMVTVKTRVVFSMHGIALEVQHCPHKAKPAAFMLPGDPGTPDVPFKLDRASFDLLRPFFRVSGGAAEACGTLVGKFVSKPAFKAVHRDGQLIGNGFGALGALQFGFILQRVVNIRSCP